MIKWLYPLLVLTLGFLSSLSAQVTYTPNMSLSDFSGIGANGGTATIRYDLVGSPAESPYGSSLFVDVHIGSITPTGQTATSPITFHTGPSQRIGVRGQGYVRVPTPVSVVSSREFRLVVDTGALLGADLQHFGPYSYTPGGDNLLAALNQIAPDGVLLPQYTFSMEADLLPSIEGWTGDLGSFGGSYSRLLGAGVNPGGPLSYVMEMFGLNFGTNAADTQGFYNETSFGDSLTTYLYYGYDDVYVGEGVALTTVNLNIGYANYQFQDITFNPVPEPGGAFLTMVGGILFMFRRRRR